MGEAMRSKEQIMNDVQDIAEVGDFEQYLIEVLIDIRDRVDSLTVRLYDTKEAVERVARKVS